MNRKHIQHLYWRAGFGILPQKLHKYEPASKEAILKQLFKSSKRVTPLKIDVSEYDNLTPEVFFKNKTVQKKFIDLSVKKLKLYNVAWINRLTNTNEELRERMTLFWANHFVCGDKFALHVIQYNNTLRKHALGDFRAFVKAVSKEASMLKYLNAKQNLKKHPNENFARELLELFTLGQGNYSEKDIQEAARAFTGYNHKFRGDFELRKGHHDYGIKTFLGETGGFNGDDIIDIILKQETCARFICQKIYRYFVNEKYVESHIDEMVAVFYQDYNIETLMRFVFSSDWFYQEENIGVKIKSPIELLVGMLKVVPVTFQNPKEVLKIQRLLGQTLLNPPNVAGWKGGRHWIDSNTITLRLKLPSVLLNKSKISTKEKGDFKDSFRRFRSKERYRNATLKTRPNWSRFLFSMRGVDINALDEHLILCQLNQGTKNYLNTLSKETKQEYCIQLMSLPEYQMC